MQSLRMLNISEMIHVSSADVQEEFGQLGGIDL